MGEFAVIKISDTGTGIDPDVVNHVFEPFFTSKKIGEGTSMGLSVVDGIVHKSGGHICVTSIKEEGTCFRVFVPVSKESEKVESAQLESRRKLGDIQCDFSHLTIMIVDDELAVANYFKEFYRCIMLTLNYLPVVDWR
jgi:hypothetical protein